jgi:hypothetical protein
VLAREPLPLIGQTEPKRPVQLVVGEVEPFERWTWHLTTRIPLDVDIRLADAGHAQTLVTVAVSASRLAAPGKLARTAVDRADDRSAAGARFVCRPLPAHPSCAPPTISGMGHGGSHGALLGLKSVSALTVSPGEGVAFGGARTERR